MATTAFPQLQPGDCVTPLVTESNDVRETHHSHQKGSEEVSKSASSPQMPYSHENGPSLLQQASNVIHASRPLLAGNDPLDLDRGTEGSPEYVPSSELTIPGDPLKSKSIPLEKNENGINRMHKFSLYETATRFYLIGADNTEKQYRMLKIDRTAPPGHLVVSQDDAVYDRREMDQLLNASEDDNKSSGVKKLRCNAWGLLGFIRFTESYYMILITKRAQVAILGGHYIYQIDGTEMVPLTTGSTSRFQKDRSAEEARFLTTINNLDLTRSFYFSYSYNITRSLQQNIIRERTELCDSVTKPNHDYQDMFVWNQFLLKPARTAFRNIFDWCHPVVHGYINQSSLDVFGRRIYITIIARRSRYFAGARFLKRGVNDTGYVANDVESEQIVSDALTTSFHAPGPRLYASPTYTSYVQHRGSIPLYWTQDNAGVTPKPDIDLSLVDPFYSAAALHFDDLFERYGAPIYVLNLIKARERTPRESKLLHAYKGCIDYLNLSLPKGKTIVYEAFDMSRAAKTRGQDVIGTLELLAEKVLQRTGFFHNGDTDDDNSQVQNGVARTNCIDCLDRTNAAQFVIGKRALGRQLHALGVIAGRTVEYDSDCVELFTNMFHGHGDTIAIQYGGSHLVNTMATYRKINQWQSSSRDMVESFKRYYHNSFLDSQRQEAYNLFLGNYIFTQGQPLLWDLTTDYYLHHENPRLWMKKRRRNYINWYTASYLRPRRLPHRVGCENTDTAASTLFVAKYDDYWLEYYRPLALSSFLKIFAFRLTSTRAPRESRDGSHPVRRDDLSPFVPRKKHHDSDMGQKEAKKATRKEVTIIDPSSENDLRHKKTLLQREGDSTTYESRFPAHHSILRDSHFESSRPSVVTAVTGLYEPSTNSNSTHRFKPADKTLIHQWTLAQFHDNSINPSVSASERNEYLRYVEHPLNLPLVVSTETPSTGDPAAIEFFNFLCVTEESTITKYSNNMSARDRPIQSMGLDTNTATLHSLTAYSRPVTTQSLGTPFSHAPSHSYLQSGLMDLPAHILHQPESEPCASTSRKRLQTKDEDITEFEEFLRVRDNPLDVEEEDGSRKRYKAYNQWLKGKSFFKQSKVDPEWRNQLPFR